MPETIFRKTKILHSSFSLVVFSCFKTPVKHVILLQQITDEVNEKAKKSHVEMLLII